MGKPLQGGSTFLNSLLSTDCEPVEEAISSHHAFPYSFLCKELMISETLDCELARVGVLLQGSCNSEFPIFRRSEK